MQKPCPRSRPDRTSREIRLLAVVGIFAVVLAGCSGSVDPAESTQPQLGFTGLDAASDVPDPPDLDAGRIATGEVLYRQYCASCHKADLSGDTNWMSRTDDGTYPPPPQDATGHTWHHADQVLVEIIRDGIPNVLSGMPTFQGTLTDEEILSILEFFKSEWGEDERAFQWQITWKASR